VRGRCGAVLRFHRAVLALIAPLFFFTSCSERSECDRMVIQPNILVVLVDALRRDHVGAYGYARNTTPYLDRIAEESVVFDQAYAHCSQTLGSTASLFTSLYFPYRLLVLDSTGTAQRKRKDKRKARHNVVGSPAPSFPEVLAESGYTTTAFLTNPHHHPDSGFHSFFQNAEWLPNAPNQPYTIGNDLNRAYLDWLDSFDDTVSPFMAYVHYMDVHNPYQAPEPWRSRFVSATGVDRYANGKPKRTLSEEDLLYMKQSYDAEIGYVDSLIEQVHSQTLLQTTRPTILVVTSDHGDEFMDHGGLGHGTTLEKELLWVPLIIHGLSDVSGTRFPHLVRQVDLGPTLLKAAGVDVPAEWDGAELLSLVREGLAPPEERQLSIAAYGPFLSLTTPRWHYIFNYRKGDSVLYDSSVDPNGMIDLSDEKPQIVQAMKDRLEPYRRAFRKSISKSRRLAKKIEAKGDGLELSPEVVEQLRELGYIQ
jgi:arylsulfatase A-like enzyme